MGAGFGSDHAASWRDDEAGELYERGRAGYPPEVAEWLRSELGMGPATVVVDVGAGTGKLTRVVAGVAGSVIAVEPAPGMRRVLGRALPDVAMVSALAEAVPLAAGSVDVVTVGQAFHWFCHELALAEIARVVRPGGALVLAWNVDDAVLPGAVAPAGDIGPAAQLRNVCDRYETLRPRPALTWRPPTEASGPWGPADTVRIDGTEDVAVATLVDRVASRSYVLLLAPGDRAALLREVRAIGEAAAGPAGSVTLPTKTVLHRLRRR